MGGDRRPWLGRLAIIGGAARGLVYVIAGGAAINAAFHARSGSNDMATAFKIIIEAPMGRVLLAVTAADLAAFAVCCSPSLSDPRPTRSSPPLAAATRLPVARCR